MWTRSKDTIGMYVQSSITFLGGFISWLSLTIEDEPSAGQWTGLMCPNVNSEVQVRLWVRLCIIPRVVELCVCVCVHVRERKTLAPSRQRAANKKVSETGHWKDGLKMRKDIRLGYKKKKKKRKLTLVLRCVQKAEQLHPSTWFSSFEGLFWRWAVELLSRWFITESGHNPD